MDLCKASSKLPAGGFWCPLWGKSRGVDGEGFPKIVQKIILPFSGGRNFIVCGRGSGHEGWFQNKSEQGYGQRKEACFALRAEGREIYMGKNRVITRRDFLRGTAYTAITATVGQTFIERARAEEKVRVILIRDKNAIDSMGNINPKVDPTDTRSWGLWVDGVRRSPSRHGRDWSNPLTLWG